MSTQKPPGKIKPFIVAVDGPAGSGKSSVCNHIGKMKGWIHINTGLIYRAVAYRLLVTQSSLEQAKVIAAARFVANNFEWSVANNQVSLAGEYITDQLHQPEIGNLASKAAAIPEVRSLLRQSQRLLIESAPEGAIVDGRDIGTVIYPEAQIKFYLTASLEERAQRRFQQLKNRNFPENQSPEIEIIKKEIQTRDIQDENRSVAPLKQADEALLVDTSQLDQESTIALILKLIDESS